MLRPWSPVVQVDLHSPAASGASSQEELTFYFEGKLGLDGYVMNLVEYLVPEEMLSSDLDDVASLLRQSLVKLTFLGW